MVVDAGGPEWYEKEADGAFLYANTACRQWWLCSAVDGAGKYAARCEAGEQPPAEGWAPLPGASPAAAASVVRLDTVFR